MTPIFQPYHPSKTLIFICVLVIASHVIPIVLTIVAASDRFRPEPWELMGLDRQQIRNQFAMCEWTPDDGSGKRNFTRIQGIHESWHLKFDVLGRVNAVKRSVFSCNGGLHESEWKTDKKKEQFDYLARLASESDYYASKVEITRERDCKIICVKRS